MSESSDIKEQDSSSALRHGVRWFDAQTSRRQNAELFVEDDMLYAVNEVGERRDVLIKDAVVSQRLGDVPRTITFADGVCVMVDDNDWMDAVLKRSGKKTSFAHFWESHRIFAAGSIIGAIGILSWSFIYGIPAVSDIVAHRMPLSHLSAVSENVYDSLIRFNILHPDELSPEEKTRAETVFTRIASDYEDYPYRLRIHGFFSVNAFALPDGLIVASDSLVELLNDDELAAVFAHEIGHVEHRHGMRAVVESSGVAIFLTLLGGDISILLSGGAAGLLNLHYSRDNEREADCFAYVDLKKRGMSDSLLGDALIKITAAELPPQGAHDETADSEDIHEDQWRAVAEALSTHPETEARQNLSEICNN